MACGAGGCQKGRQRKAQGGERRNSASHRAVRGGTARGAGLREGDSARRRVARVACVCIQT
eukprot:6208475-Pleurochrysis_carterae.AAC.6